MLFPLLYLSRYGLTLARNQQCGLYTGNVNINGNLVNVIFDTGSSSFWATEKSVGCSWNPSSPWSAEYGSGTVSGFACSSPIEVDVPDSCNTKFSETNFPVQTRTERGKVLCDNTNGILGLGAISSPAAVGIPFLRYFNRQSSCKKNTNFKWTNTGANQASVVFGEEIVTEGYHREMLYSKKKCSYERWSVALTNVEIDGIQVRLPKTEEIVFDTGSTDIVLPEYMATTINSKNFRFEFQNNFITINSDQQQTMVIFEGTIPVFGQALIQFLDIQFDAIDESVRFKAASAIGSNPVTVGKLTESATVDAPEECLSEIALHYAILIVVALILLCLLYCLCVR